MIPGAEVSGGGVQPSEMQLAGRLALSAAALLLLTLAYRYYKSRLSAAGAPGRAAAERGGGGGELVGSRTEGKETARGLRHRGGPSKGTQSSSQAANRPLRAGGHGVALSEERGQTGRAGGREPREAEEREAPEEQESRKRGEAETGSQANGKGWGPKPDDVEDQVAPPGPSGANEARAGHGQSVASGEADRHPGVPPEGEPCLSNGSPRRPGCGVDSAKVVLSHAKQLGRDLPPAGERESGLKRGEGQEQEEERSGGIQEIQAGLDLEKVHSFRATSDLDLAVTQRHLQTHLTYAFSSVAHVQVEEGLVKESRPPGQAQPHATHLRGRVYDYYVQSASRSVTNKKAQGTTLDLERTCNLSTVSMLKESKEHLGEEPAHSSTAENEEDKLILEKDPGMSSSALLGLAKATQPENQREAVATEGSISPKPSVARYSFSPKESFHKTIDNPELQVPTEDLDSPAPGHSNGGVLPPTLNSISASSLVGSMQSLQSSTTEEPVMELVAGAKFFHLPLSAASSLEAQVDLGNCYELLCLAKKQKLKGLQEAAYKVMSDNYLQVLKSHTIYRNLNAAERDLVLQKRMRGKKFMTVADISSQYHGFHASRLCYYDGQKDAWYPLTYIPVEAISQGCAICSMFNYAFVVAGCEGRGRHQKPSNRVFCYNPLTNIWQEISSLNQARPHCKLVALDGCLYAIGGECLYTVERYDPRLDRWTFVAPLPNDTFAVAHTATVCDGEICVTGGTLQYMLLRYIRQTDTWKVNLTGGSKTRTTEMVTADGFIYRFDLNQRQGISVYRCSAKARLWYECAAHPMPFPASFHCAVIGNLIYCLNRQFNLCFLADLVSPRFGTKELQCFPSPRGSLLPVILTLPEEAVAQTRV